MRVSIFGCPVGGSPGSRKTKSLFSVLGIRGQKLRVIILA
jgi:hypothetical protein